MVWARAGGAARSHPGRDREVSGRPQPSENEPGCEPGHAMHCMECCAGGAAHLVACWRSRAVTAHLAGCHLQAALLGTAPRCAHGARCRMREVRRSAPHGCLLPARAQAWVHTATMLGSRSCCAACARPSAAWPAATLWWVLRHAAPGPTPSIVQDAFDRNPAHGHGPCIVFDRRGACWRPPAQPSTHRRTCNSIKQPAHRGHPPQKTRTPHPLAPFNLAPHRSTCQSGGTASSARTA